MVSMTFYGVDLWDEPAVQICSVPTLAAIPKSTSYSSF